MFALTQRKADDPRTFDFQRSLPRLPVPKLDTSIERYVETLRPYALQKAKEAGKEGEAAKTFVEKELEQRRAWGHDFIKPGGLGRLLQERLKDVDRSSPSNWLDDTFWIPAVYHAWRVPLPINSNWWILFAHDSGIPKDFIESVPPQGTFTDWQVKRAAKVAERLVLFKLRLERGDILPDSSRAGPFCMHQYSRVFGVTRLPKLPGDTFVHSPHPHPCTHATVIVRDHYYSVDVIDPATGLGIEAAELERRLWDVVKDVEQRGDHGVPVGVCSASNRDEWTVARENILALSPTNRQTITSIEDSLFIISLDDYTLKSAQYETSSASNQSPDVDAHVVNSSSGGGTGRNRWWDKGVSIHFENSGRGGMVGEHSPCDALIPSIVADYALAEGVNPSAASAKDEPARTDTFKRLEWVVDASVERDIKASEKVAKALVKDSDGKMLWYDEYGADWIKKSGKQSPDAYLQMALQLAWHKSQGKPVATYETASTRLFLHGRTEVIRTLSEPSWTWVEAMRSGKESPKKLYELLTAATVAHNKYTRDASTGKVFDRHFFGLSMVKRKGESHPLLDDPLFEESKTWKLSTSGLSAGDRFFGTGFGTVWPDGYGINYLAGGKVIKFGIESKHSCAETSTAKFRKNLIEAMREMREVCEQGQDEPPAPKL